MKLLEFFNMLNISSRVIAMGLTHPVTKMGTRNFPYGPTHKADNLSAICKPMA
jgi:hypothetical protein